MIYLLYGEDEYTLDEALSSMKEDVGPPELRDVNITVFDGAGVTLGQLTATCDTVPFLSEKRLVVVRGLLALFERRPSARTRSRAGAGTEGERKLGEWQGLVEHMSRLPDTTDLVFVEGKLSGTNPLFAAVRPVARVRPFPLAGPGDLRQWIRGRAEAEGVLIEPRAVDALAETVGADLRVAASELRKLALYRWGETVTYSDVQELVSYAREANIFAAVDAVIEGRMPSALRQVHQILSSGRPAGYIISMMARQVRLLILAKELKSRRVGGAEQGRRLGLSGYPLRKTLEQEPKLSAGHLVEIHGKLLEADRSTKTTGIAEELTLDLLVAEICMSHGSNQTP